MQTLPPLPILAMTALGMSWPAWKLRLEATGTGWPQGNTVANPAAAAPAAVTLRATALALVGTLPRPVTWTSMTLPAPIGPPPEACPSTVLFAVRESNNRAGGNDPNEASVMNQALTS